MTLDLTSDETKVGPSVRKIVVRLVNQAESWLKKHGIQYETINVSSDKAARKEMNDLSGQDLAPVIDVDGQILADFGPDQLAKFWKQFE